MEKLTKKEFIAPLALLASVYSGLIYNFFMMANRSMLDGNWAIFTNGKSLSNILAVVFILFTIILIFSIKYLDKINKNILITSVMILVSVSCFVIALLWTLEIFMIGFIIVILAIAYLTPILARLSSEFVGLKPEKDYYKYLFLISMILWIGISAVLFYFIEVGVIWRYLYIMTGSLNLAGSLMIYAL